MHLRLSLRNRFFIVLGIITLLTLLIIWTVVRPKYEASVIAERLTVVQQLQSYTIENLDHTITSWSSVTRFIVSQVIEHPKEGEILLRSMMSLHPEIIQIKIHSPKLPDELTSQNTSYSAFNVLMKDSAWVFSKIDTALRVQWINDTLQHQELFVMQTRFNVQNIPFILTVTWDAKKLDPLFTSLPIGENYSASIRSSSAVLIQNQSSFKTVNIHGTEEQISAIQNVRQNESNWRVLISALKTAQLWLIIAVPEEMILKPVEDLMLFFSSLILGLAFIMLILGWLLTRQINRPIARLVGDVQKLSNLDFTHSIQVPAIKDLRGIGESIELLRQVLGRYQHLHVDYPKVSTDIAGVVKTVIDIQKPQLMNKSLTVEFEIKGFVPEIIVSPDLFQEAVSSLLSNAIKYGDPGRIINIFLTMNDQDIIFSIIDHGYGMSPENQEKLVTKFFPVYNPKAMQEVGTGMGLAYVKEIATYHNGSITLESDPTIGCKFTMRIPAITSAPGIEHSTEG
jgi:signal transduction histidine kinase